MGALTARDTSIHRQPLLLRNQVDALDAGQLHFAASSERATRVARPSRLRGWTARAPVRGPSVRRRPPVPGAAARRLRPRPCFASPQNAVRLPHGHHHGDEDHGAEEPLRLGYRLAGTEEDEPDDGRDTRDTAGKPAGPRQPSTSGDPTGPLANWLRRCIPWDARYSLPARNSAARGVCASPVMSTSRSPRASSRCGFTLGKP